MNVHSSSSTSTSLIKRAKILDAVAWETISKLYTPIVYKWARSAGLQENDAADIAQDVFQAVAKSIAKFESGPELPPFRGWLYGITRHKIKDHFRRNAKQPNAQGGTEAQIRFVELPEEEPIDPDSNDQCFTDKHSVAYRALELIKLDFAENTWQAFWRVAIDGQSASDVAADLKMSVGAVYTAKSRVLAHLRNELEGLI